MAFGDRSASVGRKVGKRRPRARPVTSTAPHVPRHLANYPDAPTSASGHTRTPQTTARHASQARRVRRARREASAIASAERLRGYGGEAPAARAAQQVIDRRRRKEESHGGQALHAAQAAHREYEARQLLRLSRELATRGRDVGKQQKTIDALQAAGALTRHLKIGTPVRAPRPRDEVTGTGIGRGAGTASQLFHDGGFSEILDTIGHGISGAKHGIDSLQESLGINTPKIPGTHSYGENLRDTAGAVAKAVDLVRTHGGGTSTGEKATHPTSLESVLPQKLTNVVGGLEKKTGAAAQVALEQTSRIPHGLANAAYYAERGRNPLKGLERGLSLQEKRYFSDVIGKRIGDSTLRSVAGLALDILTDPLTYATAGVGTAGEIAAKAAMKAAMEREGLSATTRGLTSLVAENGADADKWRRVLQAGKEAYDAAPKGTGVKVGLRGKPIEAVRRGSRAARSGAATRARVARAGREAASAARRAGASADEARAARVAAQRKAYERATGQAAHHGSDLRTIGMQRVYGAPISRAASRLADIDPLVAGRIRKKYRAFARGWVATSRPHNIHAVLHKFLNEIALTGRGTSAALGDEANRIAAVLSERADLLGVNNRHGIEQIAEAIERQDFSIIEHPEVRQLAQDIDMVLTHWGEREKSAGIRHMLIGEREPGPVPELTANPDATREAMREADRAIRGAERDAITPRSMPLDQARDILATQKSIRRHYGRAARRAMRKAGYGEGRADATVATARSLQRRLSEKEAAAAGRARSANVQKLHAQAAALEERAAKAEGVTVPLKPYGRILDELDSIASESLAGQLKKIHAGEALTPDEAEEMARVLRSEVEDGGLLSLSHQEQNGTHLHHSTRRAIPAQAEKLADHLEERLTRPVERDLRSEAEALRAEAQALKEAPLSPTAAARRVVDRVDVPASRTAAKGGLLEREGLAREREAADAVKATQARIKQLEQHTRASARAELPALRKQLREAIKAHRQERRLAAVERQLREAAIKRNEEIATEAKGYFPRYPNEEMIPDPEGNVAYKHMSSGARLGDDSLKTRTEREVMADLGYHKQAGTYLDNLGPILARRGAAHAKMMSVKQWQDMLSALAKPVNSIEDIVHLGGNSSVEELTHLMYMRDKRGYRKLFSGTGIPSSETQLRRAIADAQRKHGQVFIIPREEFDYARELLGRGSGHPGGLLDLGDYDKHMAKLKGVMTVFNPGYHSVNFLGDVSWLARSGGVTVTDVAKALKPDGLVSEIVRQTTHGTRHGLQMETFDQLAGHGPVTHYPGLGDLSTGQVAWLARHTGGVQMGLGGHELRDLIERLEGGESSAFFRGIRRFNEIRENIARIALYERALRMGQDPMQAAGWVNQHLFDYANLTTKEREIARRIIPFWTFFSRNIPRQVRTLGGRPGLFANLAMVQGEAANAANMDPEFWKTLPIYRQQGVPIPIPGFTADGNPLITYPRLPLTDLNQLGVWDPQVVFDQAMSRFNPVIKGILQTGTHTNFFFHDKQQSTVAAPAIVTALPPKIQQLLGVGTKFDDRLGRMVPTWASWADTLARFIPQSNTAATALTPGRSQHQSDATLGVLSWLIGPKIAQNDDLLNRHDQLTVEYYDTRDKADQIRQQRNPFKPDRAVELDWRKTQIKLNILEKKIALIEREMGYKWLKTSRRPTGSSGGAGPDISSPSVSIPSIG